MKRIILIGCLLTSLNSSLFSQKTADEPKATVPEEVMEQVVKRIVTWYFKAPKNPKTIYFAADIKKEWLPKIDNIDFVVLEKPARSRYNRKVYFFRDIEKRRKGIRISFGYGDDLNCGSTGDYWTCRLEGSRVKLTGPAWRRWRMGCLDENAG